MIDPNAVLESIDREIAFYRRRAGQVFFFSLLVEVLILGGREQIDFLQWELGKAVIYTIFFAAVAVVGISLGSEYRRRVHFLKKQRVRILDDAKFFGVFPTPPDQLLSEIQVLFYVLGFLSSTGIAIVWVKVYESPYIFWAYVIGVVLSSIFIITWIFQKSNESQGNS